MKTSLARKFEPKGTEAVPDARDRFLFEGKTLYIISRTRFLSELLAFFLEQKAGAQCKCVQEQGDIFPQEIEKGASPDMVILDCKGMNFEQVTALLSPHEAGPFAKSLVCLFNLDHDQDIEFTGLKLGVRGFFYEEDPMDHVLAGLNAVLLGQLWVTPEVLTRSLLQNNQKSGAQQTDSDHVLLTPREIEILRAIGVGASNSEIADKLFISPHTVKTHVYNAFKKINITNRFQAAIWAAENL